VLFCILDTVHGSATLPKGLCEAQGLDLSIGDYLCIRSETPSTVQPSNSQSNTTPCFLLHARISQLTDHADCLVLFIEVTEPADSFSAEILQKHTSKYTIEVIPQCSRFKKMIEAVKNLGHASEVVRSIVTYHDLPCTPSNLDAEVLRYFPLDIDQEKAVKSALSSPFTVIYGQPGKYYVQLTRFVVYDVPLKAPTNRLSAFGTFDLPFTAIRTRQILPCKSL